MLPKNRALLAGLIATTAASASAITIDDFTQGQYSLTANSILPNAEAVRNGSNSAIAGGQRDALLQHFSGPLNVFAQVDAGQVQFFSSQSQTRGGITLQYDGLDGEIENGMLTNGSQLGLNLSSDSGFEIDFRFLDSGLDTTLEIMTSVETSSGTSSFTSTAMDGTNFVHFVPFSVFTGANFADVRRIQFTFTNGAATDFTLRGIRTRGDGSGGGNAVPGPAALLPFLAGLAANRRRRRS